MHARGQVIREEDFAGPRVAWAAAVASAMPRGGTMPAAITAAMIIHGAGFSGEPAPSPAPQPDAPALDRTGASVRSVAPANTT